MKLLDKSGLGEEIKTVAHGRLDGGPGSGNFGHKGRPGKVGGSSPSGSADASFERLGKMRDVFASETAGCDKFDFLDEIGLIPKSEAQRLKIPIGVSDEVKEKRLDEIAERYFKCAERGRKPKSLDVEIRDRVANMTLDEKRQWVADAIEKSKPTMPKELNQKSDAQRIVFMMGMNETPQVVSKAEFERYVEEQKPTVVYRGVATIDTMTAKEMQFQMAYDTKLPFVSDGIYGGGLYFSTKHETALGYGSGEE